MRSQAKISRRNPDYGWWIFGAAIIAALVLIVFNQAMHFPFINYDDEVYITGNKSILRGLSWKMLAWAFTSTRNGDWQPLTWITFLTTRHFFGINGPAFHTVNILLHAANAVLVFTAFRMMTRKAWASFFLAAFFALHPLRVESVVWVSELKDVLSGFFWWSTLTAYAAWAIYKKRTYYWLAVGLYILAICAKPMVVSLPLVLLILDFWPLNRLAVKTFWQLAIEKIPFAFLAAIPAVMVIRANFITNSILSLEEFPLLLRISNAIVSYGTYIQKTLFPSNLSIFYPFPHAHAQTLLQTLPYAAALLFISFFVWRQRTKAPHLLAGWLWYLITLVPVIGILRLTHQAMADRYTYFPCIGLGFMVIWSCLNFRRENLRQVSALGGSAAIAVWAILTIPQINHWRSPQTLNEHSAKVVPNNYVAYANLGYFYRKEKNLAKAIENYKKSIELKPTAEKYSSIGTVYGEIGDLNHAEEMFKRALGFNADNVDALHNLGVLYLKRKDTEAAEKWFIEAARRDKKFWMPNKVHLASFYLDHNRIADADPVVQEIYKAHPQDGKANYLMGSLTEKKGNLPLALEFYEKAALAKIPSRRAVNRLVLFYLQSNDIERLENILRRILEKKPGLKLLRLNLANTLLTQGRYAEALTETNRVLERNPSFLPAKELKSRIIEISKNGKNSPAMVIEGSGLKVNTPEEFTGLFDIFSEQTSAAR